VSVIGPIFREVSRMVNDIDQPPRR
jgi:hypothetical protein